MPQLQRERHFCSKFSFLQVVYDSIFHSKRFRVKRWEFRQRHGDNFVDATFVETALLQPKTAGQHKNYTSSGRVGSAAMGFCP